MVVNILLIWYLAFCFTNIPWIIASDNSTLKEKSNITDFPTENVCSTDECRRSAERMLHNMDRHVDPCDNFYKFACGGFRNHTIIPAGETRIIESYDAIKDRVKNQLREILEEESSPDELNAFRQMKNYYKSCMNTTALEEQGLKSLQNILKQLNGWPVLEGDKWNETNFNWIETIYKLNDLGFSTSFFMALSTTKNPKNSSQQVLTLNCAAIHSWKNYKKIINFPKHFRKLATSLGASNITQVDSESAKVTNFLQKLANISKPTRNPIEITLENLTQQVPTIPWKKHLRRMLPASIVINNSEVILISDPAIFSQFETKVSAVPKRDLANYIIYEALNEIKNFHNDVFDGSKEPTQIKSNKFDSDDHKNRWKVCINVISQYLPLNLDALYVKKYFNEDTKTSVTEIAENVKKQFRIILQNADWLDNATQKHALDKIDAMKSQIGYSSELQTDDNKLRKYFNGLVLNESNYLGNYLNLSHFLRTYRFSKLRSSPNEIKYLAYSSKAIKIIALSLLKKNAIAIPAAVLQDYFFAENRPKYLNYGAIGFTIGHEITHSFSSKGGKYGKDGNLIDWWSPATWQIFTSRVQCLINQYNNYTVKRGKKWHLDGTRTLDENIADNSGVKIAYLAYKDWAKNSNKSEFKLPGLPYNPNQMFWITAANQFCSVYQEKWLEYSKWEDKHSLDDVRVFGFMSNRPEFAEDFQCPAGSKMNPKKKCSVW